MKRFAIALLYAAVGYVIAAVAGYFLVQAFSGNLHDREMEAAMTAVFFTGPIGAVLAFVAGMLRRR